jgi:hypothetical protein
MAQIQKGTTYATGSQVTADNLNAHVDSATLLPGAITDQAAGTALGTDLILVSKAGVLNKVTAASISSLADSGGVFLRTDGSAAMATGQQLTLGTTNQLAALNATSKGYVDAVAATRLPLTGGTLTGNLTLTTTAVVTLSKDPVNALEAATKQYVDSGTVSAKAWVNFNGSTSTTWAGGGSTVTRVSGSTTATVTTATNHNLITGNSVYALTGVVAGIYVVTVLTATTFTIQTVATTALSSVTITFQGCTIRSSYNISSVTKNGTGDYTINYIKPMADLNSVPIGTSSSFADASGQPAAGRGSSIVTVMWRPTSTAFQRVVTQYTTGTANAYDSQDMFITVFGN